MKQVALTTALLFALARIGFAQTAVPVDLRDAIVKVDSIVSTELAKENIGSVTVGVVSGAQLVWTKSYGMADMEKKIPATKDSVYRIGSVTKQFTALMLLQLVQDGKVRLTDAAEKYFPEVQELQGRLPGAPPMTLSQLASMTSGLDSEPANLPTYLKGPVSDWENVLISAIPQTKYLYEPGTHYHYSNIGYAILGASLSRAIGQPFVEYMQQRVFNPLGMTNTAFEPNGTIRPNIAKGYAVDRDSGAIDAETPQKEHLGRGYKVPNGAMFTTVGDLAKFISFELGEGPESVLKKDLLDDSFSRAYSANADLSFGYGLWYEVNRRGDFVAYGKYGGVSGYRAEAHFDRGTKTGIIVLRNVSGGKFDMAGVALRSLEELWKARKQSQDAPPPVVKAR